MKTLLAASIDAARRGGVIQKASVQQVIVDATMPKAIAYPTDSCLLERSRQHLVKVALEHGIALRQNYNRVAPRLALAIVDKGLPGRGGGRRAHPAQWSEARHHQDTQGHAQAQRHHWRCAACRAVRRQTQHPAATQEAAASWCSHVVEHPALAGTTVPAKLTQWLRGCLKGGLFRMD